MPSRFSLPHIDIGAYSAVQPYTGSGGGGGGGPRERAEHGRRVQNELRAALDLAVQQRPADDRLEPLPGVFLEVQLTKGSAPDTLDRARAGIASRAVNTIENDDRVIALYVPDDGRQVLEQIVQDYLTGDLTPKGQNPPHMSTVEAIEAVRIARLQTFWTDDPAAIPTEPHAEVWWGLWAIKGREAEVEDICARLQLRTATDDKRLRFPEITVIPVLATRTAVELMLFATSAIAEVRRASDNPSFFLGEAREDQREWMDDLAERTVWPPSDAVAVCVLDTGAKRGHALLEPALAIGDMHAVDRDWNTDDHHRLGHGTSMASMSLHGDLTAALADQGERVLSHRLESVKVLPPNGFDPAEPHSYGPITQSAVALPEIAAPDRRRVYCMAVTNDGVSGSIPSAWSAAVDQAAAGTMPGDDENAPKRLIMISGGNTPEHIEFGRIRPQDEHPIEDPAQAWNALTVGGYTDLVDIGEPAYNGWTALAGAGELSPHSRTSVTWPSNAPIKPELVMEAGNRAVNAGRTEVLTLPSLGLLAASNDPNIPLVAFDQTSAATAQCARLAAQVAADHPEFWPEMVRGLMVHSAEWTAPMVAEFNGRPGKRERYELVRKFGYGVPSYERATASAANHLALFAQAEIQPFRFERGDGRKYGDCHYYTLPIPPRLLEELENETVELKVTLSYFVDPNPGLGANVDPQRYRSHGLRFDLRRSGETVEQFRRRVNAAEREDPRRAANGNNDDNRWLLGPQSVSAGSLHCDVWTGPAIELLRRDVLCVKPVLGWCRERAAREICNKTRRYALIVTLKAANPEIDLYTPIQTHIETGVEVLI